MRWLSPLALLLALGRPAIAAEGPEAPTVAVGVAAVDITPETAIRLTGYGDRTTESEGVEQRLYAKALAIGDEDPAVIVTVDNLGVPEAVVAEVARRLEESTGLPRERLAVCSSHTHAGPALVGAAPFIFSEEPPPDQRERIERYTAMLTDRLAAVAAESLADRSPGRLAWGRGSVGFAINRRAVREGRYQGFGVEPDAPVDHSLQVLRATGPDGQVRAVLVNYACHCTTTQGAFNRIHGDWAGFAQEAIEREYPGAVALVAIGCAGDANPEPRGEFPMARQHGEALAREAVEVLGSEMTPLGPVTVARLARVDLPYAPLPSRAEWEEQLAAGRQQGRRARAMLGLLDRGEPIPTALEGYPVQVWAFGDALVMVFLGGEVVVDYAIRLRAETDADRLWINAYSNDVPCYIASDRILDEGGYEADSSMIYYGRPNRLANGAEDIIVGAVHDLLPATFAERR